MSSNGNQSFFLPTEDVADILDVLRKSGFTWVADEVELMIQQGHDIEKTRDKRDRKHSKLPAKYTDVIPFDLNEQEAILLTAIYRYFIALPACFFEAEAQLKNDISLDSNSSKISVEIARPGSDIPEKLFSSDYNVVSQEMENFLKQAWPLNTDPFLALSKM